MSETVHIQYSDGYYTGEAANGLPNGKGILRYNDGRVYEGDFAAGEWHGFGKATFESNHTIYEGFWRHNKRHGHGKESWCDNNWRPQTVFEGEYADDTKRGPGVHRWILEGSELSGVFDDWNIIGKARMRYSDGWTYDGELRIINNDYCRTGYGILTSPEGIVYKGSFKENKREGTFEVTYPDGRTVMEEYVSDEIVSPKETAGNKPVREETSEMNVISPDVLKIASDDERFMHTQYDGNSKYASELQPYFSGVIGMENVKDQLDKLYKRFRIDSMRQRTLGLNQNKQGYYFIITGSPGTGKTTVARIIGQMLCDLDILPEDVLVEVDRSKLVGEYIGQTAKLTSAVIESARGGILFIDEAYSLFKKDDPKDFGREAIDTLLKDMEDHRGEYCVIMAGYANEMNEMMRLANPGLASRFDHKITIGDYSADELTDILVSMAGSKHFFIKKEARPVILSRIEREKIDETFDNARFARRLLDEAIEHQALRLSEESGELSAEQLQVLEADDFGKAEADLSTLDSCMKELDDLIGLQGVKAEIQSFVRGVRIQNESRKRGLSISSAPAQINMVFTGNPGTGKTTVARLLSKIYYHLGLLKRPDTFVECVRADLVGRYQGETAIKVKEAVHKALGGILFIDEAYSLVMGDSDSFGTEAVNTLVSEIENNRDNLAIILAGYTKEMSAFLDSNPGLRSRLPRIVEFEDYSPEELAMIFRKDLAKRGYEVQVSDIPLLSLIEESMKAKDFGNARGVRNLCEQVIENHNERINKADLSTLSDLDFVTINDEDL